VPAAEKQAARDGARAYVPKVAGRAWVRVNGQDTEFAEADLEAVVGLKGLAGIFLPKVESRAEVFTWDAMIGSLEKSRGIAVGATKLVLSIESALGVLNVYDMAAGVTRVASVAFGGAQDGDLNTDLGCVWSIDGPEMNHARSQTLLAARAARIESPLDGVYANVRDAEGFEKDTTLSRRIGYRGRKLIHPSQIEPCNRIYSPSPQELDYYGRVLEAFETAIKQGSASTTVDGKMIDEAMAKMARRVLDQAAAWKQTEQRRNSAADPQTPLSSPSLTGRASNSLDPGLRGDDNRVR
jgi:citrate lyase subunit beta/citryl-CoA lyase